MLAEPLEERAVMDSAGLNLVRYPFWNIQKPVDVNADGRVSAFDALSIINDLNARGARSLATNGAGASGGEDGTTGYIDVNNDNRVSAMDALQVINRLNSSAGEGEPMVKLTVQIVATGTNTDLPQINKGGFYEVRILTEDLGVLTYMGVTRPATDGGGETLLGVATSFFDLQYDKAKTDFQVNEVQNINITNGTANGNFTITVNDGGTLKTTGNIVFTSNRDTVTTNIQTALNTLLGNNVVEVTRGSGTTNWRVRFINRLADQDLPSVTVNNVSLGGSATTTVTEVIKGLPSDNAAIADALKIRTFYDSDHNALNDEPAFFQDQRGGAVAAFGLNDLGGSQFLSPYQGTAPTEIARFRFTADNAGVVPFNISLADIAVGLETGVQGFGVPVTTDLITLVNDSITITEPLSAGDDTGTTTEGSTTPFDIVVTTNDVNNAPTPNTAKTVQSVNTVGTLGSVSIVNASTVRYTPPGGDFFGTDTFTYTVTDQGGNTDTATVTITITPVNDAPTFGPTTPTTQTFNEDTNRVFNAINGNAITIVDVDAAATLMTLTLNVGSGNGTLTLGSTPAGLVGLNGNGTSTITVQGTRDDLNLALEGLTYQPTQNLNGPVVLAVTVNDNSIVAPVSQQANRNITLNITPVNDAPNVELGGVIGIPSVVEGDPLVLNSANNALIQISDVDAGASPVQVTLHVTAGNQIHVETTAGVTISAGTNDTNNVILTGALSAVNNALNGMTFTPVIGSATPESFQITVNDQGNTGTGGAQSDTDTVIIDIDPATRPRARNDVLTVDEDSVAGTSNTIDVLFNDLANTGAAKELLTFQAMSLNGGTITLDDNFTPANFSDDKLVYVPAPNYFGPDSFTYTMNDDSGLGVASTGTVNVTVRENNDAPTAVDDVISNVAEDSGARTITAATLTGNDSAGPLETAQTLTIISAGSAVGGSVSVVSGNVVFTPTGNYNGPASFTYTIQDNGTTNGVAAPKTATATVTFTITEVNDGPTAGDITLANIAEDSGTYVIPIATLLASASPGPANESGQTLTLTSIPFANGGTAAIVGSNVEFTPTSNFNAVSGLRFVIEIFDNGTTNGAPAPSNITAGVFFAITPVNDAPTTVGDAVTISEGQVIDIPVRANDRDVDVNPPTGTAGQLQAGTTTSIVTNANSVTEGTATVNADGSIKFTPVAGFFGVTSFTYQLDDHNSPNPISAPATVNVTVVERNDPPVANGDTATTPEDPAAPLNIDVLLNDTDPDTAKSQWSVTIVTPPQHGTATFNTTTRVVEYTPALNYNGPDSFVYKVNDQSTIAPTNLDSGNATVNITVTEVNDAPIGTDDPTATTRYTVIKDRDRTFTAASLIVNDLPGPANESSQSLTITAVDTLSDEGGTISFVSGVITYNAPAGFVGTDFFTYTVTDNGTTNGGADPKSTVVNVRIDVVDFIPTEVNGFVFRDVNSNGTYQVGIDYPLAGVEVTLAGTSDINGAITPITVETDYLGFYQFLGVEPGDYTITESQPAGLADGPESLGLAATLAANDRIALDLPLLGLTGGVSANNFAEGGIDANRLVNSVGLSNELLASSTSNGFILNTTLAGVADWSWTLKNWGGAQDFKVTLDGDKTAATLEVSDGLNTYTTRIYQSPSDPRNANRNNPDTAARQARFRILGWDAAGNYIIRIDAKASDWFGVGTPLAAAPAPLSAGEYVEGVDAAMAEENWA